MVGMNIAITHSIVAKFIKVFEEKNRGPKKHTWL